MSFNMKWDIRAVLRAHLPAIKADLAKEGIVLACGDEGVLLDLTDTLESVARYDPERKKST